MDKIFIERLTLFSKRLSRLRNKDESCIKDFVIPWPGENVKQFYLVKINLDAFRELPVVFNEWQYDSFDEPELKYNSRLDLPKGCLRFFGITPVEFTHLFDVEGGYQNVKKFGGKELHPFCPFADIGFNIIEFLKTKIN